MTTLKSGFGRVVVIVAATSGYDYSHFFPLTAAEWTPFERVPFILISSNEVNGFLVGPWDGLRFLCGKGKSEFW
ncbi:hypothetical protein MtrunA17_Chr5g0402311 [Medicago truncatula]|uniref:Uncharacterized protein n=1 Tax=Medicago truncatula TaxID=3880 RepID=A0A396HL56_MEDTR|nr:hypothetical protein MtrunA17_Chr5g0402311 [Medicago truncatula]